MAPEQLLCQEIDARTDIYAVGLLLYQLTTGGLPFAGETWIEYEQLHIYAPRPKPSQRAAIGSRLEAVILRCLEPKPANRFSTVRELRLAAEASQVSTTAKIESPVSAGLFFEIETDDNCSDETLDQIDELVEEAIANLATQMTLVVAVAESFLFSICVERRESAAKMTELVGLSATWVAKICAVPSCTARARILVEERDARTSGERIGDPYSWSIPSRSGWVVIPATMQLTETALECKSDGKCQFLRSIPSD